jgi:hypothetical protein
MNPEPMEEVDFNPLNEIIEKQAQEIEEYQMTISDLTDELDKAQTSLAEALGRYDDMFSALEEITQIALKAT